MIIFNEEVVAKLRPCITRDGNHNLVKTGAHKEEPILFGLFDWSTGYDEYVCTICGGKTWLH